MRTKDLTYIFVFLLLISIYKDLHPTKLTFGTESPDGTNVYRANFSSVNGTAFSDTIMLRSNNPYVEIEFDQSLARSQFI